MVDRFEVGDDGDVTSETRGRRIRTKNDWSFEFLF